MTGYGHEGGGLLGQILRQLRVNLDRQALRAAERARVTAASQRGIMLRQDGMVSGPDQDFDRPYGQIDMLGGAQRYHARQLWVVLLSDDTRQYCMAYGIPSLAQGDTQLANAVSVDALRQFAALVRPGDVAGYGPAKVALVAIWLREVDKILGKR
jgi:hypothetical protein